MTNNIINKSSNHKEENEEHNVEENARALNTYKAEELSELTENMCVQVSEKSKDLYQKNACKTKDNNTCSELSETNENNTKQLQFKVSLSFCLGYRDKDGNSTNCTLKPNEPKKFLICRYSQILLMVLVFAFHCHAEFLIVFSFNPPQDVTYFYRYDGTSLRHPNVSLTFIRPEEHYLFASDKTVVNKCCPQNQSFVSKNDLTCTYGNTTTEFTPFDGKVFSKLRRGQDLTDLQLKRKSDMEIIPAKFNQNSHHRVLEGDSYLMEDGVLLTETLIYHHSSSFCSEFTIGSNTTVVVKFTKGPFRYFVGDAKDTLIWFCFAPLSIVALLLVIGLYVSQPQLRNLHGKMLICYLLSQVGFYVTTTVHKFPAKQSFFSYFFNYTLQFSILAQHCWMSAMCFDVWFAFSRPLRRPGKHKPYSFLLYSVCCWGCATLLCVSTAAVGVVPHVSDSCSKPRFEQDACFFTRRRTADLFFNTPMALALCFNLVMFLSTIVNIRFLHVEKNFFNQPVAEGGLLYFKLSLLMGINWVLVWVGFRVEAMLVYLYVRTLISIQGVVLAVVLVCNKRMWNIIRKLRCKK